MDPSEERLFYVDVVPDTIAQISSKRLRDLITTYSALSGVAIPSGTPASTCKFCQPAHDKVVLEDEEFFDENGFPLKKAPREPESNARDDGSTHVSKGPCDVERAQKQPFRFLDLPPELRNRIYNLVFQRPKQPICLPDNLPHTSDDFDVTKTRRTCFSDRSCRRCEFFEALAFSPLARTSRQIHAETSSIPYTVNTFSLHNLYYLQAFLQVIGAKGRQHLTSLRFQWKLPEEAARSLGMCTNVRLTYNLLAECTALASLDVEMDALNMLTWRGSGLPRSHMLQYLNELPHVELLYQLRGLRNVKFSWTKYEGLNGMEDWAKHLIGFWSASPGSDTPTSTADVISGIGEVDEGRLGCVHWRARAASANDQE